MSLSVNEHNGNHRLYLRRRCCSGCQYLREVLSGNVMLSEIIICSLAYVPGRLDAVYSAATPCQPVGKASCVVLYCLACVFTTCEL